MGFRDAKRGFIEAMKCSRVAHETRASQGDKNWISSGQVSLEAAVEIVSSTRGDQASAGAHHFDPSIEVWVFKPIHEGERWYVKGYLKGEDIHIVELRLLSFHPSEKES